MPKKTKLEETLDRISSVLLEAQPATVELIAARLGLPAAKVRQLLNEHTGRFVCEAAGYSVTQLPLEWHRGIRRNWIESMKLKPFDRIQSDGSVSKTLPHRMKRFLEVFETFARDGLHRFLSEATLRKRMGVSERTLRRMVDDATYCGLLKVEHHSGLVSRYEIDWFTVKEVLLSDPETARLVDMNTPQKPVATPATLSDTPATLSDTPATLSDTPATLSGVTGDHTTTHAYAGAYAHQPSGTNQVLNQNTNQQQNDADDSFVRNALKTKPGDPWPHLETENISRIADLLNLFELWHSKKYHRVEPSQLQEVLIRFIALSRFVQWQGTFRSPAARFTQLVKTLPPDKWPGLPEHGSWARLVFENTRPEKIEADRKARLVARVRSASDYLRLVRVDDDPWTHPRRIVLVRSAKPIAPAAPPVFYPHWERKALEKEFGDQVDALPAAERLALFDDRPTTRAFMEAHPEWFGRDGPQRDLLLTAFARRAEGAVSSS